MQSDKPIRYLDNIDIKEIFCPAKSANPISGHSQKSFKKGDYVYMPDEYADRIFFLLAGKIKIGMYSGDGKEITKSILSTGDIFGELALVGQNIRRDFAIAVEDTKACVITIDEMKALMRHHTQLNIFMIQLIGNRLVKMEKRLESLVFKDSRTRIVEFLHELAKDRGQRVGYETLVRGFLTHQEIANLTATSRQTVTTVLNELRRGNIITFDRRRLLIRDLEKLK